MAEQSKLAKDTGMTIPICPHCGMDNGTVAKARATGSAKEYFDKEGVSDGIEVSAGLHYVPSRTVRCSYCRKIRRDLTVLDGRVVER